MTDPSHDLLIRLTPKRAPFRRGGVAFPTLAPVIMFHDELTGEQLLQLAEEPLVDLDESRDGGTTWRRFDLRSPAMDARPAIVDPALSPERAIDPTGPIVPRDPVPTERGPVAPPEAADPAVPVAGAPVAATDAAEPARPVASGSALDGEAAADPSAAAAAKRK